MIADLVLNLALLVALSVVSGFLVQHRPGTSPAGAVAQGVLFGSATILGMLRPLVVGPGLIFDGRSILLSLCAYFFGLQAALPAILLSGFFRIHLGGEGAFMGVLVVFASAGLGLAFRARRAPEVGPVSVGWLWSLGFVVTVAMLALFFTLPGDLPLSSLRRVGWPILVFYPLATVLAGRILADQQAAIRLVDSLQRSNENLNLTLQSIGDAVISTDVSGRVVRMNPVAEQLTGWPADAAIGRPVTEVCRVLRRIAAGDVVHPATLALESGKIVELEGATVLLAREGTERVIGCKAAPIRDTAGDVMGVVLVFRDQTAMAASQEALRESEARFRSLFENSHATMLVVSPEDGSIMDANPAATAFYGWSRAELLQRRASDINTLPEHEIAAVLRSAEAGLCRHFQFRHRRADGTTRDVEVDCGPVRLGPKNLLLSIAFDVTERREVEEELRFTQFAMENMADGAFWISEDGHIHYANAAAHALLGYARTELQALHVTDVSQDLTAAQWSQHWQELKRAGSLFFETYHRTKDGRSIPVEIRANHMAFGRREYNCAFVRDVTARKRADLALQDSLQEKEALLKEVHHRVKNNLQVILSLLRLESGKSRATETREALRHMQGRIRSMALLHEALYRTGNFARVDLAAYLGQLAGQFFRAQNNEPFGIQLRLALAPVEVDIDQAITCGLLVNELLTNALKHAFPHGVPGEVRVDLATGASGEVRLEVSDSGIGLPEGRIPEHSPTLGLHLVSDLARQLRATMTIGPGPGARFRVVFSRSEIALDANRAPTIPNPFSHGQP